jgi:hypothetical protein
LVNQQQQQKANRGLTVVFLGKTSTTTKISAQPAGGRARLFFSFFFIYLFISFILLIQFINSIQFNFVTYVPKDARTRRLTARSSRARSLGLTGPLCDCAIHTYSHELARPRRTLQETQACSCQKIKKNQRRNREKRKKSLLDPGRHFPVPYRKVPEHIATNHYFDKICAGTTFFQENAGNSERSPRHGQRARWHAAIPAPPIASTAAAMGSSFARRLSFSLRRL